MALKHERTVAILAKLDHESIRFTKKRKCRTNQIDPDIDPDPRNHNRNQAVRRQDTSPHR
jgi:hypothetical protein